MAKHEKDVLQEAKDAIQAVFTDSTVTHSVTRDRLEELTDEIETLVDCLDDDDEPEDDEE